MKAIRRVEAYRNTDVGTAHTSDVVTVNLTKEWARYEQLSPPLREMMQNAPIDISASEVENLVAYFEDDVGRRAAERIALEMYQTQLRDWSAAYRASFDTPNTPLAEMIRT